MAEGEVLYKGQDEAARRLWPSGHTRTPAGCPSGLSGWRCLLPFSVKILFRLRGLLAASGCMNQKSETSDKKRPYEKY